jgi:hypothetical protein
MAAKKPLRPFQDEAESRQIANLIIENRTNRIELYGSISITRDKAGLVSALALRETIDAAIDFLKSERLPDKIVEMECPVVKKPFSSNN